MKALVARGVSWVAAGRLLINFFGFVSTLLLARLLLPTDFGLVAIAGAIAAIASAMTELSLSSALIHHRDPQNWHYDTVWTLGVLRSLLFGAVMAAMAWPVSAIYGDQRLIGVMLAFAVTNALGGFGNPRLAIFTRELMFWQDFLLGVSSKLVGLIVGIAVAYLFRSYWALVAGSAAAQFWALAVGYALKPAWPHLSLRGARELFGFSIWLSLGQIANQINWKSDQFLVGYFLGTGPLGHYSYASSLASLPTNEATAPIAQTLFPAFSRMTDDLSRMRTAYQRAQSLMFAIALPTGVGFAVVAQPLVQIILGEKWQPAVFVIQALASIFAVQTMSNAVQPLAMAMGKTRSLFNRDVFLFVVRILLIVVGLMAAGLTGVVVARIVSGLTGTMLNMLLAQRILILPFRQQIEVNSRALIATAGMVIVVVILQKVLEASALNGKIQSIANLSLSLPVGVLTYIALTYVQWRMAGKPEGPECEVISAYRQLFSKFSNKIKVP